MKHTPGPWHTCESKLGRAYKVFSQSNYVIADIPDALAYGAKAHLANARLMAASPDLLLALDAICKAARMADERDKRNAAVPWELITAAARRYRQSGGRMSLRPVEDIEPHEWARYWKAKRTVDLKVLAGMVPACVKPYARPTKHEGGIFTFAELRHEPGAAPRLPNLLTKRAAPKYRIPPGNLSTAEYVKQFYELNSLVKP